MMYVAILWNPTEPKTIVTITKVISLHIQMSTLKIVLLISNFMIMIHKVEMDYIHFILHWVIWLVSEDVICALLEVACSRNSGNDDNRSTVLALKNKFGQTPLDIAKENLYNENSLHLLKSFNIDDKIWLGRKRYRLRCYWSQHFHCFFTSSFFFSRINHLKILLYKIKSSTVNLVILDWMSLMQFLTNSKLVKCSFQWIEA